MTTIELKNKVARVLPKWRVTVDEAQMLNLSADDVTRCAGIAYVEEFSTDTINTARYGAKRTTRHEITFCKFGELEQPAEEREKIRERDIMPAVKKVIAMLQEDNVTAFNLDKYPRGFDANEVLVHLVFTTEETICLG